MDHDPAILTAGSSLYCLAPSVPHTPCMLKSVCSGFLNKYFLTYKHKTSKNKKCCESALKISLFEKYSIILRCSRFLNTPKLTYKIESMSETLQKAREVLIRIFKDSDLLDFLNMTNYDYGIVEVFGRRLMLCETQCSDLGLKGAEDEPLSTVYKDRLFIFDSLNATADAFLRKKGISFCDGEGNLNLALGAMTMESHGVKRQAQPQINLMTETSLKAILGLLSAEGLVNRPMREIAEFCGVSIGSVQRLIEALKQNHFIFVTPKGRFLKNMRGLLDLWVRGFNMVLRPKYYLGQAIPARPEAIAEALPEGVCWGGEQAAALRDGYLVPAAFSVFTTHSYRETCLMCKFLPVPVGNVSVYRKFWSNSIDRGNVAPDLVIYAELMSMGDSRCAEAAHRLVDHEKYAD